MFILHPLYHQCLTQFLCLFDLLFYWIIWSLFVLLAIIISVIEIYHVHFQVGPLRCWPGGLCLSRSIGDMDVGECIIPVPHVKQVKVCSLHHIFLFYFQMFLFGRMEGGGPWGTLEGIGRSLRTMTIRRIPSRSCLMVCMIGPGYPRSLISIVMFRLLTANPLA